MVYVGDDGDVPESRSLAVHQRGRELAFIKDIDKRKFRSVAWDWKAVIQ